MDDIATTDTEAQCDKAAEREQFQPES